MISKVLVSITGSILLVGCGGSDPDEGRAPYPGIKPTQAILDLQNPESLRSITFPSSASLVGIREEALRVYMVFDMAEKDLNSFLDQAAFKKFSSGSMAGFPAPERGKPSWWMPSTGVAKRYSGNSPENRAVQISINKSSVAGSIRVYVARFNI